MEKMAIIPNHENFGRNTEPTEDFSSIYTQEEHEQIMKDLKDFRI